MSDRGARHDRDVLSLMGGLLLVLLAALFLLDDATGTSVDARWVAPALLVVVGAALTRGPEFAAVLGFAAGLLVDLAPPADHIAGRWALALVVVGYVAGRIRQDTGASGRPGATAVVIAVAASSFIGTSVFAFSGLLLDDAGASVPQMIEVILIAVVWDVLLTPFVLPLVMAVFGRLWPPQVAVV